MRQPQPLQPPSSISLKPAWKSLMIMEYKMAINDFLLQSYDILANGARAERVYFTEEWEYFTNGRYRAAGVSASCRCEAGCR